MNTKSKQTVMVVEDEEAFIDALVVGLQREGFGVEVARDGAEALSNFDKINP
ncbi:MAG: DNA-binding response regulator, partial [Acidimicrobiaceae bacterium]|nr:DNA-binding response regulator [Acidimicrobiaceae bacterium]